MISPHPSTVPATSDTTKPDFPHHPSAYSHRIQFNLPSPPTSLTLSTAPRHYWSPLPIPLQRNSPPPNTLTHTHHTHSSQAHQPVHHPPSGKNQQVRPDFHNPSNSTHHPTPLQPPPPSHPARPNPTDLPPPPLIIRTTARSTQNQK